MIKAFTDYFNCGKLFYILKVATALCVAATLCFSMAACRKNVTDSPDSDSQVMSVYNSYEEIISEEQSSVEEQPSSSEVVSQPVSQPTQSSKAPSSSQSPSPSVEEPTKETVSVVQNREEIRAVWISYLEMQTILKNKTERQFTKKITEYFEKAVKGGLNTVIVQVRSHCDAYYASEIFPASNNFTGKRTNSFPFDPLKIMVNEAHKRGLRIEAWVNPYRGPKTDLTRASNDPISDLIGTRHLYEYPVWNYSCYYLNPASDVAKQLILRGVAEIVDKYDVDGIHFDDYFYTAEDEWIDAEEYAPYASEMTLTEFRQREVTELVADVYALIKSKKDITFGISPAGNLWNCINKSYADVKLWASESGYVDYIAPQLYWNFGEGELPYEKALEEWCAIMTNPSVDLLIGLAAYKVNNPAYNITAWQDGDILKNQVTEARERDNYKGFILFRYDNYFDTICETERKNLESILT